MNTKLHAICDSHSRPLNLFVTAGQVSDYIGARALLSSLPDVDWLLGDRGYDADWFREALKDKGIRACTLARSALFENISGAYLYATLVSALPLYVGAVERSALFSSLARRFPWRSGSMIVAMALFAVFVLVLTGLSSLGAHLHLSD